MRGQMPPPCRPRSLNLLSLRLSCKQVRAGEREFVQHGSALSDSTQNSTCSMYQALTGPRESDGLPSARMASWPPALPAAARPDRDAAARAGSQVHRKHSAHVRGLRPWRAASANAHLLPLPAPPALRTLVQVAAMSTQLVWELVKKHHAFIRKSVNGTVLSAEPGNL